MKRIVYILLFIPLLQSCTEVIDFDLNDEQARIVIDAVLTDEVKQHQVRLTKSTSFYFNEIAPTVSGADVSISGGGEVFQFTESATEPGLYLSAANAQGKIGVIYTLNVFAENETYTAIDTLRGVSEIDTVFAFPQIDTLFTLDTSYTIIMFGQEKPGRGDHYMWNYYVNDTLRSPELRDKNFGNDDFVDGSNPVDGFPVFTGINFEDIEVGDRVRLEMLSVGEDYLDYAFELFLQTDFRGGFFDGPPANIRTNLSNGALGYFRTSAVVIDSTLALPLLP